MDGRTRLPREAGKEFVGSAAERKTNPQNPETVLAQFAHGWLRGGIAFVGHHSERVFSAILEIVAESAGKLNFNDTGRAALNRSRANGAFDTRKSCNARNR